MYKVVSKMTLMWQETWFETGSAASAPMQKLVDIVRTHGPHLLSDDELAGMKRTQDQIRNRMEQMSRDVDKRFYSPANPVFQSLSDDDRREILHDKGRREEMLRQQMRTMGLEVDEFDDATFGPDARHVDEYALTFANEYFGEDLFERDRSAAWSDGVLLDTAVGSPGSTVRNRFVDFLKGHESGAIPAGITDVGRYVGDGPLLDRLSDKGLLRGADTPLSTAVTRILATGNGVPALDTPFDSLALYHTDLLAKAGARPVGHIPDARSLLRDHPLMDPEATFDEGADPEVIEMHHRHKKDAPSGTAERLLEILRESRSLTDEDVSHGRSGMVGERKPTEIGSHALRGGDVVGEHTVMFAGIGERIELTHRATDRAIFAAGALRAAKWVVNQAPGLYSMQDVLGLSAR